MGLKIAGLVAMGLVAAASFDGAASQTTAPAVRDGARDFDFNLGTWRTQIKRIKDPFAAASESVALEGTVTVRKVWGGRAWLEEIEADGPTGHWQGSTFFLYSPAAGQWAQYFVNSASGRFDAMPLVGEFRDGRGDLYAQDSFAGRTILVRGEWSNIRPESHDYVESYSDDGGRSWKPAFIAHLTRLKP